MIAGLAAALAVISALCAAPLVLGSYAALQGAGRATRLLWLGFLTLLCLGTLGLGGAALLLAIL